MQNSRELAYLLPALKALRPPENMPADVWIEKNIILPPLTSGEPGPMRLSRVPYARGPLIAFNSPYVEHIVLVWGRQLGKSQSIQYPCLAYSIVQDPGPALFLMPSKDVISYTAKNRIRPFLDACPAVDAQKTGNFDDITTFEMRYLGMVISLAGAGSEIQVMSRPVRYLLRDETDAMEESVGRGEADPMSSSEETTSNFSNRKIIDTSTPSKTTGNIWRQFKQCNLVFEYWVDCLRCGQPQIMFFKNINFHGETEPHAVFESADYQCQYCGGFIKNHEKPFLLGNGRRQWRARTSANAVDEILESLNPDIKDTVLLEDALENQAIKKIGFHLPKWYSPFPHGTFGECARKFLEAQGDFVKLQDWNKFWAARPLTVRSDDVKIDMDSQKIEGLAPRVCPNDAIAVVMGIDPGQRGFWWTSWATLPNHRMHLIDFGFKGLVGQFLDEQIEEYRRHIFETFYPSEDGQFVYPVWRAGKDTGGGKNKGDQITMTAKAYLIIRQTVIAQMRIESDDRQRRAVEKRFLACKGGPDSDKTMRESRIDKDPRGKPIPGGLILWILNVERLKTSFSESWNIAKGGFGGITMHNGNTDEFMKHIKAEEMQQDKKGQWKWVQISRDNHLFDCTITCYGLIDRECWGGVDVLHRPQRFPANQAKKVEAKAKEVVIENIDIPKVNKKLKPQRPRLGWFGGPK